jgi:hypothetical protein
LVGFAPPEMDFFFVLFDLDQQFLILLDDILHSLLQTLKNVDGVLIFER